MVTRLAVLLALGIVLTCLLATTLAARAQAQPLRGSAEDFERAQFDDPARIDNRWLPLRPGTQYVLEGSAIPDEGGRQTRRVVTTVTDLTKVIDGVKTLVIWERDFTAGQLSEPELAFFAQDNAGNVWLVGEYPEEYEDGKFDKAPAWISGQKGARAGIAMPANPQLGMPDYAQGFAPPPADFTDRSRVYKTDQQTCTPVDCYENVLVTEEFNPPEPGAFQLKYYASGVGNVRVGWRGPKEEEKETLELVELNHLGPEAMGKVRREAMEMDERAYERSSEVYRETPPAEHTLRVRPAALAQETTTLTTTLTTTATPGLPQTGGLGGGGFALLGAALLLGAGIVSAAVLRRRS
jgi:LPXTG-motif cell wall-anchored protein